MAQFQVGDLVRITAKNHGHEFRIGQLVRIEGVHHDTINNIPYYNAEAELDNWYVEEDEVERA